MFASGQAIGKINTGESTEEVYRHSDSLVKAFARKKIYLYVTIEKYHDTIASYDTIHGDQLIVDKKLRVQMKKNSYWFRNRVKSNVVGSHALTYIPCVRVVSAARSKPGGRVKFTLTAWQGRSVVGGSPTSVERDGGKAAGKESTRRCGAV